MSERKSLESRGSERLAARRRRNRRRGLLLLAVLFVIALGALEYGLWRPAVRISNVEVYGTDASLASVATEAMQGTYFGLIPRNSTFFIPEAQIRSAIMKNHTGIAAISIFRKGLTGLVLKAIDRTPVAHWCGLAPTPGVDAYCYVFDASGVIFAAEGTTTETIYPFTLYAPLAGDGLEPVGGKIAHADELPATFDFARELATFGSRVDRVVITGDEVNDYLMSGTRITYVLGNEKTAYAALASAKSQLNLADGSLEYIDLRFDGKVYLKRKVNSEQETVSQN